MQHRFIFISLLTASLSFSACSDGDEDVVPTNTISNDSSIEIPTSYEFLRNGSSSVSYSGQTDRLNQLAEIKSKIQLAADNGASLNALDLKNMFENTNGNGNGQFSFSSSKQLKDKTFDLDKSNFDQLLEEAASASDSAKNQVMASNGVAGLLRRSNGNAMLLNSKGHELTQAIEKGLMGATFYHQIVNSYLTDGKIGPAVNNQDLSAGKNYTEMEHHMDEAFGYFGAPIDFQSNYQGNGSPLYWAKYAATTDVHLKLNDQLMNAYKLARASIVVNNRKELDKQVRIINELFEVLIAASAIHYINDALAESHSGDRMHVISEAFYFLKALRYSNINFRKFNQTEVDAMLYTDFGDNLWQVSSTGLNSVKDKLSNKYKLNTVKDQL